MATHSAHAILSLTFCRYMIHNASSGYSMSGKWRVPN